MLRLYTWPAVILYSFAVVIFSTLPVTIPVPESIPASDKILHAVTYLVLAWLLVNTLIKTRVRQAYLFCFSYAFLLGLGIECVQKFLPFRSFEYGDILANALGASVGLFIRSHKHTDAR